MQNSAVWRINNDELPWHVLPEDNSQIQTLPNTVGRCHSKLFKIEPDLSLIETHFSPNRNLAVISRMTEPAPRMVLTLSLTGHSCFNASQGNQINFKFGHSTITTINASDGIRQYQSNQAVSQLRFSMTQTWLEQHFGEGAFSAFFKHTNLQVISYQPSSTVSVIAAHSLLNHTVAVKAQALFRRGQVMTILACELEHLLGEDRQPSGQLTQTDKRIAEWARAILAAEFKNPPSVETLSKQVGTNQFKLKKLFHRCFNTTPYGMLLDIRMEKAYQLLASSRCPVNIVAEAVGYQHASNFSAAFIKYYGVSPKHISRES